MNKKTKNAPGSRVVLYARVSTEEQAGEDHFSIPAQLHEMQDFAQARGWEVVGEFVDEGISGTVENRPQLQAMLDVVNRKACDIVLVHELSRLSRSVYYTLDIFEKLGINNVGFASVRDPDFDFTDPSKRFFLTITAAINEYYIELLRQHTSKAKRERAKQGLYNASLMPYGYTHSGNAHKPPTINQEESAVVQLAFENYSSGRFSDQEIADLLNQKEYRTRSGRRFSKDAISELLTNPFYRGKVLYRNAATGDKELFAGQHKSIISEDLWEKCQSARHSRRTLSRAVQKKFRSYLLSNLAVCDVCGRTLRAQGAKSGSYYREMSYERGYADCPHQKTGVRAEVLEKQVHTLIHSIQLPQDWIQQVADRVGDDDELINLRRQRDRIEVERRRVQEMRIEGEYDDNMQDYHTKMDQLRRESASLPTYDQIETLKLTARTIGQLYDIWDGANPSDQRDLLRLMLREVRIDVPNGRITSITPRAFFLPIFRELPFLHEYEFGVFAPLWENDAVPPIDQLPEELSLSEGSTTLPFFELNPLLPEDSSVRIAPGITEALRLLSDRKGTKVVQVVDDVQAEFPMDLRKWPHAKGVTMNLKRFLKEPEKSVDIVVSQFLLGNDQRHDHLQHIATKIKPGGVWYFNELLPLDSPGDWLYRALPATWEWAKENTWSVYAFYNRLTEVFAKVKFKRHVFVQPFSYSIAEQMFAVQPFIVQSIAEDALPPALTRLKTMEKQNVSLQSEFTILEGWAKMIEEA